MKLNHPRQRCHRGRKGKMAPSSKLEAEEEGEVVMNIPHMEEEAVMNKEEGEVDVVAMTMVAEGEEEEISSKEAGQMEGVEVQEEEEEEAAAEEAEATKMVVIEIRVSNQVAIMVATVVDIKVVVMEVSKHPHIQEVDTRVVDISRTDTRMVGTMVIEAVVVEGEVVVEAEEDVEAREEEVGEEGEVRIITKGGSLNSTSSMEVISIIILDLDREDITLVEATEP